MDGLTIYCRRDTGDQALIYMIGVDHVLQLVYLLLRQRVEEPVLILLAVLEVASQSTGTLLE